MSADAPPTESASLPALPAWWEWNLGPGYYELTVSLWPGADDPPALYFAGFPVCRRESDESPQAIAWQFFVPAGGNWPFHLKGRAAIPLDPPRQLTLRRIPLPQPGLTPTTPSRGVCLDSAPRNGKAFEEWLSDAVVRGATFAFGTRERMEAPHIVKALETCGLLALPSHAQVHPRGDTGARTASAVLYPADSSTAPVGAFSGWERGGALSPLSDEAPAPPGESLPGWWHHVTKNGVLALKHAAWSDLAEVWYHPRESAAQSPPQGLLLARIRGVGVTEPATAASVGNAAQGGWQASLPLFDGVGLLHFRWDADRQPVGPTTIRSPSQTLGTCIPASAAGDLYCPWFPGSGSGGTTVISGTGAPPPDAISLLRSRVEVRPLWEITPGPGRHRYPTGVGALAGYEQPSRTKDVLIGLRIAASEDGSLILRARTRVRSPCSAQWQLASPEGRSLSNGGIALTPGDHHVLIPTFPCGEGRSFLLKAPRRSVHLLALAALHVPITAHARASGPHWAKTDLVSRLLVQGTRVDQLWSVRMVHGQPWFEFAASTAAQGPLRTRLTLDIPRFDQSLINGRPMTGAGPITRTTRLIVLKDSSGLYPNLTLVPRDENAVWTVGQVGTSLVIETADGTPFACIIAVGRLERWGGANMVRRGVAQIIRPVSFGARSSVRLRNTASKAIAALAEIESNFPGPYWVQERSWWRRVEAQECIDGGARRLLVPLHIPGRSSVVLARGEYLHDLARPTPGSYAALSLSEAQQDGALVRVTGEPAFGAPLGVEFNRRFTSVTCDGRPWHVHDGKSVWLPAGETSHRIHLEPLGEPTPTVVRPRLPIISTGWTGVRFTVRLADKVVSGTESYLTIRYPHDTLSWVAVEGGTGEVVSSGEARVRPIVEVVHIRFVPRQGAPSA